MQLNLKSKHRCQLGKKIAETVLTSTHNLCFDNVYPYEKRFLFHNRENLGLGVLNDESCLSNDIPENEISGDYPVESCKISVILFASMLQNLKGH